jgi:organic radical activating enzyme
MSDDLIKWRDENLNSISSSFCAAKWYNASIFLGSGYTGSCHLPLPHPIDINEISYNPSAIHNTDHKKRMRKMMLEGKQPAECGYCWKVEGIGRNNISDRINKSIIYKTEDIKKIKDISWNDDVNLKTLEISFDRQCNFACSYCNASYSTSWSQDLEKHGPYQNFVAQGGGGGAYQTDGAWSTAYGRHLDDNPYVEAFFEWWPELSTSLQELRVTGGEATVSQNFWRFIEKLQQSEYLDMRFAVNSNLGMSPKALERLIDVTKTLPVKEFDLFTSNESFGLHAEYLRDGLKYDVWRSNLVNFIENAKFRSVTIMMTISNLCLFSITEFMDDMIELKKKYGNNRPYLDLNILRWPAFMSPVTLPNSIKDELQSKLTDWYNNHINSPYLEVGEKASIKRLIDYLEVVQTGHVSTTNDKSALFHDFKSFYSQYDVRRNKNLVNTFPDLAEWYESIELNKDYEVITLIKQDAITYPETGIYKEND